MVHVRWCSSSPQEGYYDFIKRVYSLNGQAYVSDDEHCSGLGGHFYCAVHSGDFSGIGVRVVSRSLKDILIF